MCKCVGVQALDAHLHICAFALFLKEKVAYRCTFTTSVHLHYI